MISHPNPGRSPRPIATLIAVFAVAVGIGAIGFVKVVPQDIFKPLQGLPKPQSQRTIQVLVARAAIGPGQYLDESNLVFEARDSELLPDDAITRWELIHGKVAIAPMSRNTIVTKANLGTPVALIPALVEPTSVPPALEIEAIQRSRRKLSDISNP